MIKYLGLAVALTVFLVGGAYAFTSQTVPVQESGEPSAQQMQACDGVEVGEADYNYSVEDRVLAFEGLFCASNIGYNLQDSGIDVEGENVTAYADISAPQGVSGPAVTPVRFNASEELEPGEYNLEIRVEVENELNISDNTDLSIESEEGSIVSRLRNWFRSLF